MPIVQSSSGSWLSDVASAAASAAFLVVALIYLLGAGSPASITGLLVPAGCFVALLSLGLTLVLRTGRLDLSAAALPAMGGMLAARLAAGGQTLLAGAVAAVAVGAAVGLVNGLLGSLSRMAAAAATLGTAAIAEMVALQLGSGGQTIVVRGATDAITPVSVLLLVVVGIAVVLLLTLAPARAALDTVAGPEEGWTLLSLPVIAVFVVSGALAALAGVLQAGWLGAATPTAGTGTLLPAALAAALIGGSSLRGGQGAGYGAVLAAFATQAVLDGMLERNVDAPVQFGVIGGLLLVAVLWSEARSRLLR